VELCGERKFPFETPDNEGVVRPRARAASKYESKHNDKSEGEVEISGRHSTGSGAMACSWRECAQSALENAGQLNQMEVTSTLKFNHNAGMCQIGPSPSLVKI